jgi:hypothetical protein
MKPSFHISLAFYLTIVSASSLGCRSKQSNHSQLIAQMVASPAGPMLPIQSATLVYRILPETHAAAQTVPATLPQPVESAAQSAQLLVIRYPNPSGKRNSALAELVVTERATSSDQSVGGWSDSWKSWIRESLPGIAWSDGVQEAKALTIPVRDLQSLLSSCRGESPIQLASHQTSDTEALLLIDIDGQPILQPRRRSPELDALICKIRHQGQLVSCLVGSGAELAEMASATNTQLLTTLGNERGQLFGAVAPSDKYGLAWIFHPFRREVF